ncbi:RNA polymerase sigma factor [Rubrolithibacter danxiaensis]|uniref:RNA polymerase sigma factor n=1 Tax=Rubrolithibacter danxiaensis TaxID=3390805 RepID=UPI003BF78220
MLKPVAVSEEELLQKCKKGDLKYLEKLYKHFYSYAMGVGLRYLSDRDDVLEVVNDSFIKVFGSIHSFNLENPFKPWLRKIVVNTAIDRRRKNLRYLDQVDIEEAVSIGHQAQVIDELNAEDIRSMLNNLPEMQRVIFNLYEIDGYNHEEIGTMLNIPESSSRVYLSRAKEKLRKNWNNQHKTRYEQSV